MRKSTIIRAFLGLAIVVVGGILFGHNLGLFEFNYWGEFWATLFGVGLSLAGLLLLLSGQASRLWGALLLVVGVLKILDVYNILDVNIWKIFWPALLIIVGLSVAFNFSLSKRNRKEKATGGNEKVAVFYGEESRVKGDYDGGSATAIFGGVELDLRQAKIKDGAVIEIFTFCGSVGITLPDDVIVKNEVRGILGGSEDKTMPKKDAKKTLHLRGECVLGGLEIK